MSVACYPYSSHHHNKILSSFVIGFQYVWLAWLRFSLYNCASWGQILRYKRKAMYLAPGNDNFSSLRLQSLPGLCYEMNQ